jgi:hypothetical protein
MLTRSHMETLKHEALTYHKRCKSHLYLESNQSIQIHGVKIGIRNSNTNAPSTRVMT